MTEPFYNSYVPKFLLIVDDNDLFRRSMGKLLKMASHQQIEQVYEASTGEAAMQTLATYPIECVLLDYQMPGGDGVYWMKQILGAHPDISVIMITGEGDELTAVEVMKSGAMDYLIKGSLKESDVLHTILNAMEKRHMKKALSEQREQLLQAERQRAMITSLATACHHLGQPATVIIMYLEMMKQRETSPEMKEMIDTSLKAAEGIGEILSKLHHVSEYRTIPYLPTWKSARSGKQQEMLDI
ncbi:MAG: response regulator [Lentisphaerota bacterium]